MEKFEKEKSILDGKGEPDEWNESEHPRDQDGKFTNNGFIALEQNTDNQLTEKIPEDISNLLGESFSDVKGQDAVYKLITERRGHIKGAFFREGLGEVDLLWGDSNVGLSHIMERRTQEGEDMNWLLSNITEVIEQGELLRKNKRGNFEIWHDKKLAVVSPEIKGNKITFLLTAFKRSEKK